MSTGYFLRNVVCNGRSGGQKVYSMALRLHMGAVSIWSIRHIWPRRCQGSSAWPSPSFLQPTGAVTTGRRSIPCRRLLAQVDGAVDTSVNLDGSGWQFPCGSGLPDFNMWLNGNQITIPGSLFALESSQNDQSMCLGGLEARPRRGSTGYPFWLAFYVVFNPADPSISFAPQA